MVKFPRRPLGYWPTETLSKLASIVGKPIYTDRIIADMERISFPRVLIETDISQPFSDSIKIHKTISDDWRPKYCSDCMRFGHAKS